MGKKLKKIEVKTLPNGYALEIEGSRNGFFYFDEVKLLEGFMIHVGLEMLDQLNTDTMQDFIMTAINWKDNKACVKEIERLSTALKVCQVRFNAMAERLVHERKRYVTLYDCISATMKDISEKRPKRMLTDTMKRHKKMTLLSLDKVKMEVEKDSNNDEDVNEDE